MKFKDLLIGLVMAIMVMLLFWAVESGLGILMIGVKIVYQLATGISIDTALQSATSGLDSLQVLVTILSTLFMILILKAIGWFKTSCVLSKGLPLSQTLGLGIMLIGLSMGINVILEYLDLPDYTKDILQEMSESSWGVLAISIIGPIGEEVAFRGAALQKLMDKGWGVGAAIFISGLLFGITHLNPVQVVFASILGWMLGWVYVKTKSVIPCIGLHILNNLISTIFTLSVDNPDATMADVLGKTGADILMVVGLVVAAYLFYYLNPRLKEMY